MEVRYCAECKAIIERPSPAAGCLLPSWSEEVSDYCFRCALRSASLAYRDMHYLSPPKKRRELDHSTIFLLTLTTISVALLVCSVLWR
jgi:hypothetical protein